ncbi:hypothetical protein ANN_19902 [Periplaneta americana]|uniref:Uncharacterized protein n=1 Tax=Periplaneta americana TaxID=6978 RepID=A0ABQ8SBD2_PERAM|nr:hypothetical protein ANN_19902 [Periplaneta americana]
MARGTEFGVVKASIGIYTVICLQPFIPSPPLHDILAALCTSTTGERDSCRIRTSTCRFAVQSSEVQFLRANEACNYYAHHLKSVKKVVQSFDLDDAAAIQIRQELLNDRKIEKEVMDIKTNFGYLPDAIIQLERSGVEIVEQIIMMRTIVNKMSAVEGEIGKRVGKKMNRVAAFIFFACISRPSLAASRNCFTPANMSESAQWRRDSSFWILRSSFYKLTSEFLINVLPTLLEYVPCQQRLQMWFMHDGTPTHFFLSEREHLTLTFQDRWIDWGSLTPWPARSPNLNPLAFGYREQPERVEPNRIPSLLLDYRLMGRRDIGRPLTRWTEILLDLKQVKQPKSMREEGEGEEEEDTLRYQILRYI